MKSDFVPRFDGSRALMACATAAVLTACGGGSSGPQTSNANPPGTSSSSVTVSWSAPAQNTDGSALSDLTGFRIFYGSSPSSLSTSVDVNGTAATSQQIAGLRAGTYYFAVTAVNGSGVASTPSSTVQVTVR